jgi:hypothetical protein
METIARIRWCAILERAGGRVKGRLARQRFAAAETGDAIALCAIERPRSRPLVSTLRADPRDVQV